MHFGNGSVVAHALWLVPALIIFYLWAQRTRQRSLERFADAAILDRVLMYYNRRSRRMAALALILAIIALIITLARPQWGFYWKENRTKGIDIIIAIDTSKSMLARDVVPDRLSFVKVEVKEFVKKLRQDRVGLIAFSGGAFLQCPLTADYRGYLLALNDLSVHTIGRGGTAISNALREAVRSFKSVAAENKILVLVSDGEHNEGDINKAIALARSEHIRVFCIGVGTTEGAQIPEIDAQGNHTFVKDDTGHPVVTCLTEGLLRRIAAETGGTYVRASELNFGLDAIYEHELTSLKKYEVEGGMAKIPQERFQWPLTLALILLIISIIADGGMQRDEMV